ncbi:MAG: hypothetical protein AABY64_05205 [Bdellovibrionota bacterium]
MKKTLLAASWLFFSCATTSQNSAGLNLMSESEFETITETYTEKTQVYSGLYNIMDLSGTLMNSAVARAQLDQNARLYQWDAAKMTTEKVKSDEHLNKETEIFISFFTPERKHDDLHKNQTLWKIFMDINGKRYEGKVKKIKLLTDELRGIYPYHTRFATPYSIVFPVSAKSIESLPVKLTVTGPVGSASLQFKTATTSHF